MSKAPSVLCSSYSIVSCAVCLLCTWLSSFSRSKQQSEQAYIHVHRAQTQKVCAVYDNGTQGAVCILWITLKHGRCMHNGTSFCTSQNVCLVHVHVHRTMLVPWSISRRLRTRDQQKPSTTLDTCSMVRAKATCMWYVMHIHICETGRQLCYSTVCVLTLVVSRGDRNSA